MKCLVNTSVVAITTSDDITTISATGGRVFNFVPGLEALPIGFSRNKVTLEVG